jgi:hypothetical protein
VGNEQWVDDVVIATRDDLLVQGQPEQFGFLLLADGVEVYLNDQDAVAELGRRLAEDMEPTGYAQILVAFHPYSSAARAVLTEPDGLRRAFSQPDLPDVEPIRLRNSVDGLTLTFASSVSYTRPGEAPLLDVLAWTVDVPAGERARWNSQKTLTGIRLDPGDGAQRQQQD